VPSNYFYTLTLKCSICKGLPAHLGQVNNVFLIVAITAVMAIVTAVLTFFVDLVAPAVIGNSTQTATDALAVMSQTTRGH
jgi:hypothetical protein